MRSRYAIAASALLLLMPMGGTAAATKSVTIGAAATKSVTIGDFFFNPAGTTASQNDTLTWTNTGGATHTTTSAFPRPFGWSSGDLRTGARFSTVLTAAGTYSYRCVRHSNMTGSAKVPIRVTPSTGGATTKFTIRVATGPAPSGFDFIIERKPPGATSFAVWRSTPSASVTFVPDQGRGTYSFRSSVRKLSTGQTVAPSLPRSITVS